MQVLLDILVKSKAIILAGEHNRYFGICRVVRTHLAVNHKDINRADVFSSLYALFEVWPEFSGNIDYPVKHPDYIHPGGAFEEGDDLWVGEYGAARMRLLDWMIDELQRRGYVLRN